MELRICNVCNVEKPTTDFYFRKEIGTYRKNCKKCKPLVSMQEIKARAVASTKICKHCGIEKVSLEYGKAGGGKWLQPYCKPCDKIRKDKHKEDNAVRYGELSRANYLKHKKVRDSRPKPVRILKESDPEYVKKRRLEYSRLPHVKAKKRELDKAYRRNNEEKLKKKKKEDYELYGRERAKNWQRKMSGDFEFNTKKRLRGRIYVALKRGIKSEPTMKLLGCTIDEFKIHFESKFTEGMSWEEYMKGGIHIDHIIPCKNFDLTNADEQKKCFHYTNLQPLWRLDNLRKGTSLGFSLNQK